MIVYKIKFYVNNTSHLTHKCFFVHFEFRSDPELDPDPIFLQLSRIRILGKMSQILIPG